MTITRYNEYYIAENNSVWGSMGEDDYMNDVCLIKSCGTYAEAAGIRDCFERNGVIKVKR